MNNNKNNYTGKALKGPVFSTTSPSVVPLFSQYAPTGSMMLPGEKPYNEGSVANHINNYALEKAATINNVNTVELYTPLFIEYSDVSYNPGGIYFELVKDDDGNYSYEFNTAFTQANIAAVQAKQNLSIKQLTQLNFYSEPQPAVITSNVQPLTIAGLATVDITAQIYKYMMKQAELYAFVTNMISRDKLYARSYQEIQRQMSRSRYVTSLALLDSVIRSFYLDTTTITHLSSLIKVCETSKGINGWLTRLELSLKDNTKTLSIFTTRNAVNKDPALAQSLTVNLEPYNKFINFYEIIDLAKKYHEGKPFNIEGGKINDFRDYVNRLEENNNKVIDIMQSALNNLANYYAAYEVISTTDICSTNFAKGISLLPEFAKKLQTELSTKHLGMYQVATSIANLEMHNDDVNNVSLLVPTVQEFVPYSVFTNNSLLYWIKSDEQFEPILDWTHMRMGKIITNVREYRKDNSDKNYVEIGVTNSPNYGDHLDVVFTSTPVADDKQFQDIAWWVNTRIRTWTTRWATNYGSNTFTEYSPIITGWLRYSFKVVTSKVLNNAPNSVGFKNVNPLGAFYL